MFAAILFFLVPLAFYCWVISLINRRSRPTMVSGVWDCAGMLMAAGGILLVLVPFLLNQMFKHFEAVVPAEENADQDFTELFFGNRLVWGLYFSLLVVGVSSLLWWRRNQTVIYNVDPDLFPHVLHQALADLGLEGIQVGKRLIIAAMPTSLPSDAITSAERPAPHSSQPQPSPSQALAELAVDVFRPMANVSLRWMRNDADLRTAVEEQIRKHLEEASILENNAVNWLLGLTGILFGLIILTVMMLVLIRFFPPRR